jgi:hypothetical protein
MSALKLPGKAKENNLPSECGQPIDADVHIWNVGPITDIYSALDSGSI